MQHTLVVPAVCQKSGLQRCTTWKRISKHTQTKVMASVRTPDREPPASQSTLTHGWRLLIGPLPTRTTQLTNPTQYLQYKARKHRSDRTEPCRLARTHSSHANHCGSHWCSQKRGWKVEEGRKGGRKECLSRRAVIVYAGGSIITSDSPMGPACLWNNRNPRGERHWRYTVC